MIRKKKMGEGKIKKRVIEEGLYRSRLQKKEKGN